MEAQYGSLRARKPCICLQLGTKNIKVIFDLPWATHRWVLEEITGKSLKMMLLKRFLKFVNTIAKSHLNLMKMMTSLN